MHVSPDASGTRRNVRPGDGLDRLLDPSMGAAIAGQHGVGLADLGQGHGALQFAHAIVLAAEQLARLAFARETVGPPAGGRVVPALRPGVKPLVVGGDETAFAAGVNLVVVEAEAAERAEASQSLALERAAAGLGHVFDDRHALAAGDVQNRVHLGRRPRMWTGTMALVRLVIAFSTAAGSRQSVSSTSTITGMALAGDDRRGRGEERVRRHDHFVAGADSQRPIRADQRRRAGIDRQAVLHADQFGPGRFGRLDFARPRIVVAEQVRPLELPIGFDQFLDALFCLRRELPKVEQFEQFLAADLRGIRPQARHGLGAIFGLLGACHDGSPTYG